MFANIFINNKCNLRCHYCFAQDRQWMKAKKDMPLETFKRIIDSYHKEMPIIQLQGGEPTLHPEFKDMVSYVVDKYKRISLISNGIFDLKTLKHLLSYGDKVSYLWNVNDSSICKESNFKVAKRNIVNLARLGTSGIGVNVYKEDMDFSNLNRITEELPDKTYAIRIGYSHSTGLENSYSKGIESFINGYFLKQLRRIISYYNTKASGFMIECGVSECFFNNRIKQLLQGLNVIFLSCDGTCINVDVEGDCILCYQNTSAKDTLKFNYQSSGEIVSFFIRQRKNYNAAFRKKCDVCHQYLSGSCSGFCSADLKLMFSRRKSEYMSNKRKELSYYLIISDYDSIKDKFTKGYFSREEILSLSDKFPHIIREVSRILGILSSIEEKIDLIMLKKKSNNSELLFLEKNISVVKFKEELLDFLISKYIKQKKYFRAYRFFLKRLKSYSSNFNPLNIEWLVLFYLVSKKLNRSDFYFKRVEFIKNSMVYEFLKYLKYFDDNNRPYDYYVLYKIKQKYITFNPNLYWNITISYLDRLNLKTNEFLKKVN